MQRRELFWRDHTMLSQVDEETLELSAAELLALAKEEGGRVGEQNRLLC